jgi:phage-related protein
LTNIGKTLEENGPEMLAQGVVLLAKIALGIVKGIPDLVAKIPEIVSAIGKAFAEEAPAFKQIGADIVRGVWNGILSLAKWIKTKVSDFFSGIVDNVKGVLGIHSPSRVFAGIGENMALGVGEGWGNEYGFVKRNIEKDVDFGVKRYSAANHGVATGQSSVFGGQQDFAKEIKIVVQSVLDGKVIGETAYQYGLDLQRAYGGAY